MNKVETAKVILEGMTLDQMLGTAAFAAVFVVCIIGLVIWISKNESAAIKESLKSLQRVPKQLDQLNAKVESSEQLDRRIAVQIQQHELTCPVRNSCKSTKKE